MNTLAYIIYFAITFFITVYAGFIFYKNGRIYLLALLRNDATSTDAINRLLLLGYYLLNLGYVALMIKAWKTVDSFTELVSSIAQMTSTIMLSLAIVHFCNMTIIYLLSKRRKQHLVHHTN